MSKKMNALMKCIHRFKFEDGFGNIKTLDLPDWREAVRLFNLELENESRPEKLEEAVVYKWSWALPIECKFRLLEKAKAAGCDSFEFWKDYYCYRATYLDPNDPERPYALEMANGKYL